MIRLFPAIALAMCAPAALAAQPPPPPAAAAAIWTQSNERITLAAARISLPRQAGPVRITEIGESSRPGEGLDNMVQYRSADGAVFATAFLYFPGLPHAGLQAFASEEAIRAGGGPVTFGEPRTMPAGGIPGAAILRDYSHYRGSLASSAAFIKAGRWIVGLRVSGPDARRSDVDAAMAALLAGIGFEGEAQPRPAELLEFLDCAAPAPPPAHMLADDGARNAAMAIVGTFDGAGEQARDGSHGGTTILPGRVGSRWCLSTRARIGESTMPILRALEPSRSGTIEGDSLVAVPLNDAGTLLEAVRTRNHDLVILLYHEVGRTTLLGTYDGPPSDEQIANILSGADEPGTRIRAVLTWRPGQGANIEIGGFPSAPASSPN